MNQRTNLNLSSPYKMASLTRVIGFNALLLAIASPMAQADHTVQDQWFDDLYLSIHAGVADSDVNEGDVQDRLNNNSITGTADHLDADRNGYGLGLGYQLTERWAIELDYLDLDEVDVDFSAPATFNGLDDIHPESGDGFTLSALYSHPLTEKWSLRARLGVFDWEGDYSANTLAGNVKTSDDGTDLYAGIGAGYEINEHWAVNAEYQFFDFDRDESTYLRLGLVWRFGGGSRSATMPAPVTEPVASILAPQNTSEPITEPAPQPVVEPSKEEVCKLFDGSLDDAQFEFASAQLTDQAKSNLSSAIAALKSFPTLNLEVQAHTDSIGRDAANQLLSDRRAQSVMAYFIEQGITADRLSAAGYGEAQPIADNATKAGRAMNRRVELKPIDQSACR